MTNGCAAPDGGASRTATPGIENCAGGAGGSEGRLAEYTTRGAPGAGRAGYHSSTVNARSTDGAEPLAASKASTSICPCCTKCSVLTPTAPSPSRASSGASTPKRLGGSPASAGPQPKTIASSSISRIRTPLNKDSILSARRGRPRDLEQPGKFGQRIEKRVAIQRVRGSALVVSVGDANDGDSGGARRLHVVGRVADHQGVGWRHVQ